MEAALVTLGGILILLSAVGGASIDAHLVKIDEFIPKGDRAASGMIGALLIAIAIELRLSAPTVSVLSTYGVFAGVVVVYSVFLLVVRNNKGKSKDGGGGNSRQGQRQA